MSELGACEPPKSMSWSCLDLRIVSHASKTFNRLMCNIKMNSYDCCHCRALTVRQAFNRALSHAMCYFPCHVPICTWDGHSPNPQLSAWSRSCIAHGRATFQTHKQLLCSCFAPPLYCQGKQKCQTSKQPSGPVLGFRSYEQALWRVEFSEGCLLSMESKQAFQGLPWPVSSSTYHLVIPSTASTLWAQGVLSNLTWGVSCSVFSSQACQLLLKNPLSTEQYAAFYPVVCWSSVSLRGLRKPIIILALTLKLMFNPLTCGA
jgi:hypothetical protein